LQSAGHQALKQRLHGVKPPGQAGVFFAHGFNGFVAFSNGLLCIFQLRVKSLNCGQSNAIGIDDGNVFVAVAKAKVSLRQTPKSTILPTVPLALTGLQRKTWGTPLLDSETPETWPLLLIPKPLLN
jgi:hypothetical protein